MAQIFVYFPVAHWVWGGGWLGQRGVLDFAGGIVVHTTAGTSAAVTALFLGQRKGFAMHNNGEFPPSNLPLAVVGAGLLLCGWFGFNAGSALKSGNVASSTVVSTQIGACVSGLVWMAASSMLGGNRAPSLIALMNGTIAGLAGITPASGFIDNQGSLALGVVIGVSTYAGSHVLKQVLKIDDALEVTSVHGLSGMVGSVAIGFLATSNANPALVHQGLFYGGGSTLLVAQLEGVAMVAVYSVTVTLALLWALEKLFVSATGVGLRANTEDEGAGLDISEHGEVAYHELFEASKYLPGLDANMPLHFGAAQAQRRASMGLAAADKQASDSEQAPLLVN